MSGPALRNVSKKNAGKVMNRRNFIVKYSYVVLQKGEPSFFEREERKREAQARVLSTPIKNDGHIIADVCSSDGKDVRLTFTKLNDMNDHFTYKHARKLTWGSLIHFTETGEIPKRRPKLLLAPPSEFSDPKHQMLLADGSQDDDDDLDDDVLDYDDDILLAQDDAILIDDNQGHDRLAEKDTTTKKQSSDDAAGKKKKKKPQEDNTDTKEEDDLLPPPVFGYYK